MADLWYTSKNHTGGANGMIRIFDVPEYMTITQAEEKFYPNSFVMIKCTIENFAPVDGYVAAAETRGGDDFEELSLFENRLLKDPANGEVFFIMTDDPYAGQGLFISQDF
jgi:hypothetical protein